jgi:AsmA family protein
MPDAASSPQPATPPSARLRRPSSTRWRRGSVLTLLLLAAAVIGCEVAGWPFLRLPLQRQMEQRLGVPVRLAVPFELRLLRQPGIDVGELYIGSPQAYGVPHLVQAEGVSVAWHWRDLLAHEAGRPWPLQVLQARALDAHLVRRADGSNNWGAEAAAAAAPDREGPPSLALPVLPRLFALQDGRLRLRDAAQQLELDSRFAWQEGVVDADADADANTDAPSRFRASAEGRWHNTPFALKAEALGLLPLVAANGTAGADRVLVPLDVQARVGGTEARFRGVAAELFDARALNGSILVRGPSLAPLGQALGVTLPSTPPFRLAGALRHDAGLWGLVATEGHIGGSRLVADLQFDSRGALPRLTGTLGGPLLRLKDLGPAVGTTPPGDTPVRPSVLDADGPAPAPAPAALAVASAAAPQRAGRVLPDRSFDLPSLRAMDADIAVAIGRLDLGDDSAIAPLQQLRTRLSLQRGVLTLADLHAQVAGGTVQGLTRLDAADPTRAALWRADLRFAGLRLEQWLPVLQQPAPGTRGRAAATGAAVVPLASGTLDARVDVQGAGRNTAAILASLDGRASARVRDGTVSHLLVELAGIDLAQSLGVWLRGDRPLQLSCARLDSQLAGGVVVLRQAVLETRDSTLRAEGRVSLRDESLALRAQVKPKDFSLLSLRAPIVVGGSLAEPEVGIEGRRLAPRLIAALALAAAAPPAALLPLLEFGDRGSNGDKADPAAGCAP